jgi:ABC-type multidrug transport system permease subunit
MLGSFQAEYGMNLNTFLISFIELSSIQLIKNNVVNYALIAFIISQITLMGFTFLLMSALLGYVSSFMPFLV